MVVEVRRYLGDTQASRIHDADHEHASCRLGEIPPGHRRWYDNLEDAKTELPYEHCPWCFGSRPAE
jgi:hypothetical protein